MSHLELTRRVLPVAALLVLVVGMMLPVVRLRLRTGAWAVVVHRGAAPLQSFMGTALGLSFLVAVGWAVLFGLLGPGPLDAWTVSVTATLAGWTLFALGLGKLGASNRASGWKPAPSYRRERSGRL